MIETVSSSSAASSSPETADVVAAYVDLPNQVHRLSERLEGHSDPGVAEMAAQLRSSANQFNRVGVERLVRLIMAWRGELFFDAAFQDPIIAAFLGEYDVPRPD